MNKSNIQNNYFINPQLQDITAVKEGHFIRVKLSEITPGVRTVDALKRLAEEIHGVKSTNIADNTLI